MKKIVIILITILFVLSCGTRRKAVKVITAGVGMDDMQLYKKVKFKTLIKYGLFIPLDSYVPYYDKRHKYRDYSYYGKNFIISVAKKNYSKGLKKANKELYKKNKYILREIWLTVPQRAIIDGKIILGETDRDSLLKIEDIKSDEDNFAFEYKNITIFTERDTSAFIIKDGKKINMFGKVTHLWVR